MSGRKAGGKNARITMPIVVRMRALRSIGLSTEAIARVIDLDYGTRPHPRTIGRYTDTPGERGFIGTGFVGVGSGR